MDLGLNGKVAIVTGGSRGIGLATAELLVKEGARVVIAARRPEHLQTAAKSIGVDPVEADVTKPEDLDRLAAHVTGRYGGADILVNNAGIGSLGSVEDEDYQMFQKVMTVDVDSIFLGCKYAIPLMRDHGLGSIINISSIAGIIASGNYVSYNTAKAAVRHMSKSIALHCAKTGGQIRSNSVHPVFINTPILDRTKEMFGEEEALAKLGRQIPMGKVGEPDDIAYAVLYLASDESKLVTGIELKVDGGISAM